MSKRRLYFHISLLIAAIVIGCLAIWESGIVPEGKNYPNLTALAMMFMVIGQLIAIKSFQN